LESVVWSIRGVAERRRPAASEATHKLQACRVRGSDGDYAGINGPGRVLGGTETALRRACWHELNVDCWRVEWIDMDLDLDGRRRGSMSEIKMSRGWLTKGRVPDDRRGVVLVRVRVLACAKPRTDMTKSPPVAFHSSQLAAYNLQPTAHSSQLAAHSPTLPDDVTRPASASSTPASMHARPALTRPTSTS
jgi:hypothetical protein